MAALFEELIEEILSRLPAKSLLRFKTASKNWYSLISKDYKFQLKQLSTSPKNLILYHTRGNRYASALDVDITNNASHRINFRVEIGKPCRIIGSANGLICVESSHKSDCCYIWNPYTGESKRIYVPFLEPGHRLLGFGYDSTSDDYKIVKGQDYSQIEFFSLKNNSWKKLENSDKYPFRGSSFYSNGALHWCVGIHNGTVQITAFDLAKDQIVFLDLPEGIEYPRCEFTRRVPFFDYQGTLCVSGHKSIWVMKEYGNPKSWTKLTTISLPKEYARPVGISRLGELVFRRRSRKATLGFVKSDIQRRMFGDYYKLRIDNS